MADSVHLMVEPSETRASGADQPRIYRLGDITVAEDLIITPNGNAPLPGSFWMVADNSRTVTQRPMWATVVGILLMPACFLGFAFFFVRSTRVEGNVEVRVEAEKLKHLTQIPVEGHGHVDLVRSLVGQLQFLAR